MLDLIENLPDGTVGISARGEVCADDYRQVLRPAVEAALQQHDKINFLYELGPDFTGFSAGALLQDALVGLRHPLSWHKLAVVTSHDWIEKLITHASALIPGQVKVFEWAEQKDALSWLAD